MLTLGLGAMLGCVNGLLVTRLRLTPLVATLATLTTFGGLAFIIAAGEEIYGIEGFAWLGQHHVWHTLTAPTVAMLLVIAITATFVRMTKWGLRLLAVGGGSEAARRCGIKINAYTTGAFAFSGCMAALAAAITLGFVTSAEAAAPTTVIFDAITAVALAGVALTGGQGSIVRVLAGALVIAVINTGLLLTGVAPYYAMVVTGVLLIAAVVFDSALANLAMARETEEPNQ
jgi:ribose transport system permease protein